MPDIFVSHATANDARITQLQQALAAAGIKNTWVDHINGLHPGDNWSREIQQAANDCESAVFAMSPASVKSVYCEAEWNRVLTLGKLLYPIMIEPLPYTDIPLRLGIIQFIDFTKDWDKGIATLIATLKGEPLPDDAPVEVLRPITGSIDRRLLSIPISGRDDDLTTIKNLLKTSPTAILGVGGLGKSRLAAEIVLTSPDIVGAIWHIVSDISRPDEILELLREHFSLDATADRPAILKKLRGSRRLIVLDNAEDVPSNDLRRLEYVRLVNDCLSAGAQVLLTSRVEWPELRLYQVHNPHILTTEAAEKIVVDMASAWGVKADLQPQAADIAKHARFHPRLIEWAVGLMRKFPVNKVMGDLAGLTSPGVQAALDEMIHKTLRQMTEAAGDAPAQMLKRLNVCRGGFTYEAVKALNRDSVDLDTALETLQTYLFIRFDGTRYSIDPLVLTAVGEDETAHRLHYDFYKALAKHHDKKQDYLGLDPESANLETAFEWALANGDGEDAYWLSNACRNFLSNRGRFGRNKERMESVAAKLANHPDETLKANVQISLSIVYGEYPLGSKRENLRRSVAACEQALRHYMPESSPLAYALTQNNLGNAYRDLAGIEERGDNLRRSVAAYEQALRFRTPESAPLAYAMTQNNLGTAYRDLADMEERGDNLRRSVAAYEQALRFRTPESGPLDYALTQNNLGIAYSDLASIEARGDNLRRAVAAYEQALRFRTPESAPLDYAMTQANLGLLYKDLDELGKAIVCRREAEIYFRRMDWIADADKMLDWIADTEAKLKGDA